MTQANLLEDCERCPECGCAYLVRDSETGEVVCRSCGVVVGEVEYATPFTPADNRGSFALTRLAVTSGKPTPSDVRKLGPERSRWARLIGRLEGVERTEARVANMISGLADRLCLPKAVQECAMVYAKKLLGKMREKGRRLMVNEVSIVSLWNALKVQGYPVLMKEFAALVKPLLKRRDERGTSLYKLLTKAAKIVPPPTKGFTAADYVGRLGARLGGLADQSYISSLEAYAIALCKAAEGEVFGKDPVCVAATALCVADEAFGSLIGGERIAEALGAGYSQSTAKILKRYKPPLPPNMRRHVLNTVAGRGLKVLAGEWLLGKGLKGGDKA